MSKIKKELNIYPFYDGLSMAEHFEDMAKKGWQLRTITKTFITYRQSQPENLRYAITYFADASQYDVGTDPQQAQFMEYCAAAGWKRVTNCGQLQVFSNTDPDAPELETDPLLTLEVIHSTMKYPTLTGYWALFGLSLLQLYLYYGCMKSDTVKFLSTNINLWGICAWIFMGLITLWDIGHYYMWYKKAVKSAGETGVIPSDKTGAKLNIVRWSVAALFIVAFAGLGLSWQITAVALVLSALYIAAVLAVPKITSKYSRNTQNSKRNGFAGVLIVAVLFVVLSRAITSNLDIPLFRQLKQPDYIIEDYVPGLDFKVYSDDLPLYLDEFYSEKIQGDYSFYHNTAETILLVVDEYEQSPLPDQDKDLPFLYYTVVRPKSSFVYDLCLKGMLTEYDKAGQSLSEENKYRYVEEKYNPAAEYGATKIWRLTGGYSPLYTYIIQYEDKLVSIRTSAQLTTENQWANPASILSGI